MAKERWIYACQNCGQQQAKWSGQCPECKQWNTIAEERDVPVAKGKSGRLTAVESERPVPITEVSSKHTERIQCGISSLDEVLGGGLVPGSVVLLGGEPGIGKSTLLLQAADQYAKVIPPILYISGEESAAQISLRAKRLGVGTDQLLVVTETSLEAIEAHVDNLKPKLIILDSVQTIYSTQLESQPGSVGQLRECTYKVVSLAKSRGMAAFLVGHVTKEGNIAGPKVLEHMVDVVLYFEGSSSQSVRLLRSMKNRFGSSNELAVFEMVEAGLRDVINPSELFLAERPEMVPGSVVTSSMEGSRPLLVEVQALASPTSLSMPRRTAIGLDPNRVSLMVAILEKRGGFQLYDQDVYVNVAGGLRLTETATDLAVTAALISSCIGKAAPKDTVFFGEVGLGGEVRSVPQAAARVKEAHRIGMKRAYLPRRNAKDIKPPKDFELVSLDHIQELANF